MEDNEDIILHIIVVGFHHKKGYQVEFTHPQWPTGDECPAEWSHLPSIAMPDGSHNYHQETVYFHLPPIDGSDTVYGVSCYRQMDSDRVVNRTEDITRQSVQKSVIALSRLPLYGQIQVKLELITSAYFETGDFSRVEVLREAYTNLNQCLSSDMLRTQQVFVGLSVRDLVLMFRHKLLVLFKLVLLERRVLLQHSPVSELCSAVLALTSLLPEMVQAGLGRAVLQPRPPSRRSSAAQSPSQPAAQTPGEPAAQSPSQPAAQTPGEPAAQSPEQLAAQSPSQPAAQTPGEPAAQSPSQPAAQSPSQPAAQTPGEPAAQSPEQPAAQSPGEPAAQSPEQPAAQSPSQTPAATATTTTTTTAAAATAADTSAAAATASAATPVATTTSTTASAATTSDSSAIPATTTAPTASATPATTATTTTAPTASTTAARTAIASAAEPASGGGPLLSSDVSADTSRDLLAGNSTFYRGDGSGGGTSTSGRTFQRRNSDSAAAAPRRLRPEPARASVFYDTPEAEALTEAAARSSRFYLGSAAEDGAVAAAAEGATSEQQEQQSVDARLDRLLAATHRLDDVQCGMPLRRFRRGHLCHPYLCLSDIHLLADAEVLTFLAGATNVLYSHKRHLVDAYVTMSPCSVELSAPLRRQLALSTEDLRLADLLVRAVTEPGPGPGSGSGSGFGPGSGSGSGFSPGSGSGSGPGSGFSPGSGSGASSAAGTPADGAAGGGGCPQEAPRGSDAWLRAVFRLYLYMLLRTSLLPDGSAEHALYNSCYIAALKETPSYVQWADSDHPGILEVNPGHPCSGQLSMADMRLKISQTFQSSERGRKVTQVAAMTGRAVGGALTVARGALSSWWSSLATPEEATPPAEPALDAASTVQSSAEAPADGQTVQTTTERRPGRPAFEAANTTDSQPQQATPCP